MSETWEELQAAIPWDVLHDTPAPAVAAVPLSSPSMPSLTPMQRRNMALGFVAALLIGGVVLFALGRVSAITSHPATVAPIVVGAPVTVVTATPGAAIIASGPRRAFASMPVALPTNTAPSQPTMTLCCNGVCGTFTTTAAVGAFATTHKGETCGVRGEGWTADYQRDWYNAH